MEIVFQPGATLSNDESMKIQCHVYTSQNIGSLKLKETLRADIFGKNTAIANVTISSGSSLSFPIKKFL